MKLGRRDVVSKKMVMVESLLFIGAGAGEKTTRSRTKMDRLRNTVY